MLGISLQDSFSSYWQFYCYKINRVSFLNRLVTPVCRYQLMNYTLFPRKHGEEILKCTFHCRLDVMQVQSCAKNTEMFFFFLISNLLCLVAFFFAVIVNVTWYGFCFKSLFVCLLACLFLSAGSEIKICLIFFHQYIWWTFAEWLFHNMFCRAGLDFKIIFY